MVSGLLIRKCFSPTASVMFCTHARKICPKKTQDRGGASCPAGGGAAGSTGRAGNNPAATSVPVVSSSLFYSGCALTPGQVKVLMHIFAHFSVAVW